MINLTIFNNNLFDAGTQFFNQLGIQLNSNTASSLGAKELLKDNYKEKGIFQAIDEAYFLGLVDDSVFDGNTPLLNKEKISLKEAEDRLTAEYNGLMVFAVRLKDSYSPTRGEMAELTRAFNRISKSVPVVLLLKYGGLLSFAASERTKYKQAWREGEKIGKISLLKDIKVAAPHTGHVKILDDLKVAPAVTDFNALYKQWQEVFNVQLLNKKFYQELANWYFWALRNVEFPEDAEKNKDVRNAISVIRMITRLIFIWFVKEKGLVPDDLFNQAKLKSLLDFSDKNQSTYYKAILQNLFFATLNTEMNKDKPGSRKFRGKNKGDGRDQHYMIHNVFRYEDYFTNHQDTLKKYFENIPFLNGGLFECLDKEISPTLEKGGKGGFSNKKVIRIDGFSDRADNPLKVPDELFFSEEKSVDLNQVYGTKNKTYKVRGLIDILESYKFTVDENTPIEEEIALDPELLGKVFENLLASYNPETQTTARKQTGSFYTPREIVNYMVDESIIAYLGTALNAVTPPPSAPPLKVRGGRGSYDERLRHLLAYNDEPHKFTSDEVDVLIAAINTLKALDPACGSGAFPMGMLHKLVYILGKLDPDNSKWREVQRQKAIRETEEAYNIGDKEEREKRLLDISEVFENNASDYGRKLYLIENCIFGVDIQPIAVQIAKLRFFVSLIVDQRINSNKENLGVRPLPNLETKFVAANTLIGIEKPEQMLLRNPEIDRKEKELKEVRERHFTARTPQTKEKYRKEDERLRAEISELLKKDGFPRETTEKLAKWNPYDQNASADFFDSEWMFGITDGFNVVIGNPPYVRVQNLSHDIIDLYKQLWATAWKRIDISTLFMEFAMSVCKQEGTAVFISSNQFLATEYGRKTREFFLNNAGFVRMIDFADLPIFENTLTYVSVFFMRPEPTNKFLYTKIAELPFEPANLSWEIVNPSDLGSGKWVLGANAEKLLINKMTSESVSLGEYAKCWAGLFTGMDSLLLFNENDERMSLIEEELLMPVLRAQSCERYRLAKPTRYTIYPYKEVDGKTTLISDQELKQKFPKAYSYLKKHKDILAARKDSRTTLGEKSAWYGLVRFGRRSVFEREKIVSPGEVNQNKFTLDMTGSAFSCARVFAITSESKKFSLRYLLGLLNSKLFEFYLHKTAPLKQGGYYSYSAGVLDALPIKVASQNRDIEALVDQILAAKKKDPNTDTSPLEKQIDEMVYALYGLTPEEIAVVEGKK